MRTQRTLTAAFAAALAAVAIGPSAARAQKALVYCPTGETAGCTAVVAALGASGAYADGVDKGYDGADGTVDLKAADLFKYSVVFIPSLSDDAEKAAYAFLRDTTVAGKVRTALLGRRAFYSGTPDLGGTNRDSKDALIVKLAGWAAANYETVRGPGLVVLQDHSDDTKKQYDWALGLTGLTITSDWRPATYDAVRTLTGVGAAILSNSGAPLKYENMASFGFYFPSGAPGISMDAVGQTGTNVGGNVVLVTADGANTGGAWIKTDKNDYAPGTTVVMTAGGFQPGEAISILLHEDPAVHEDRTLSATADASGNFEFTGFAPEAHDLDVRFVLTATGQVSGRRAQTTFTDGPTVGSVTVGSQSPNPVAPGVSATYTITVQRGATATGAFNASLTFAGANNWPNTATANISPTTLSFPGCNNANQSGNPEAACNRQAAIITIVTTSATTTPTNGRAFSVRAQLSNNSSDFAEGSGTLVVQAPTVTTIATTTSVTRTAGSNPSVYGDAVAFTATVTGSTNPTSGTVTFRDAQTTLCTATLSGSNSVTCTPANTVFRAGGRSVTAEYGGTTAGSPTYTASTSAALAHTVTPKALTITGVGASNKGYDGNTTATLTYSSPALAGRVGTDAVALDQANGTGAFADKVVGANKPVTVSGLGISGVDAANYTLTQPATTASITAKSVTGSFTAANKSYDGTTSATVATSTVTGAIGGDVVALSGTAAFATKAAGTGKVVTLGGAALTGADASNYALAAGTITTTASITAKPVTGTVTVQDKPYDGNTTATVASAAVVGAVDGDAVTLSGGTAAFAAPMVGTSVAVTASGWSLAGADQGNYQLGTVSAPNAAINKGTPTFTFSLASLPAVTYGDAEFSVFGGGATYVNRGSSTGDVTFALGATSAGCSVTPAGVVKVDGATASGAKCVVEASLAGDANHTAAGPISQSFAIGKRAASVTPAAAGKTYGDQDPTLSGSLAGFLATDGVTATYSRTAGETAGGTYTISASLSPAAKLGNYDITTNTAVFTIAKAATQVALTCPAAAVPFTGAAQTPCTATVTGPGGLSADVPVSYGNNTNAGSATATASYDGTANYAASSDRKSFTITAATPALSISWVGGTYTGSPFAATATATGVNDAALTAPSLTYYAGTTATGAPLAGAPVNAGTYTVQASFAAAGNYAANSATRTIAIAKANQTITWSTPTKIVYGTELSGAQLNATALGGATLTYSPAAGTVLGAGSRTLTASAAATDNYNAASKEVTLVVDKAALTIKANDATREYGAANPAFSGSVVSGAKNGESFTISATSAATTASPVGSYAIVPSATGTTLGNYDVTAQNGTLTINAVRLTVTADAQAKVYGETDPALTYKLAGGALVGDDKLTGALVRAAGENVGEYAITQGNLSAGTNYNVIYTGAKLTIGKRAASVTPDAKSKTYGDADPELTGKTSGFLTTDNVQPTYSRTAGETAGGTYTISASLGVNPALGNYDVTANTAAFTIAKRAASVTPAAAGKTYGEADPALSGKLAGFLETDGVTATYSRTAGEAAGGTYTISAVLSPAAKLGNYEIAANTAAFTIAKAATQVALTCPAAAVTYTGAAQTPCSAEVTGPAGLKQALTVSYGNNTDAGAATASASYGESANYLGSSNAGGFMIAPATPTLSIVWAGGPYTGSAFQATGTAKGVNNALLTAPVLKYYAGSTATGTPLGGAPVNAGTYTVQASFAAAGNYAATAATETIAIAKATSATVVTVANAEYNGQAHGGTAQVTGAGSLSQALTVTYEGRNGTTYAASPTAPTNAGDYTASATYAASANHEGSTDSKNFSITKATPTVTVSWTGGTYGAANPANGSVVGVGNTTLGMPTFTYEGVSPTVYAASSTAPTNAGSYKVTASFGGNANYAEASNMANTTIEKAATQVALTCPATVDFTGVAQTPCTAEVTGAAGLKQALTVTYQNNTNAGSATASASYATTANYAASADSKSFTIAPVKPTLSIVWTGGTYTGSAFAATATATGVDKAPLTAPTLAYYTGSAATGTPLAGAPVNAGTYTVQASFTAAGNYSANTATQTITITKASAVVQLDSLVKAFTGQPLAPRVVTTPAGLKVGLAYTQNGLSATPTAVGVYTVRAAINDQNYAGENGALFVIYDPNGGFVTGGGWIESQAGWYTLDPTVSGKAHFGFVSKYQKGASVPTGTTEFQFQAGNLNFKSTSYEWLVVSGPQAQFKGEGTIASRPGEQFGFILTAVDNPTSGDAFRIKIYRRGDEQAVVYDNGRNSPLGGGSIQIQQANK